MWCADSSYIMCRLVAGEDDLHDHQSMVNETDRMDPQFRAQIARLEARISRVEARREKLEVSVQYLQRRMYAYGFQQFIFGATEYATAIDIWSVGCVLAELLLEQVLGTPTREEIKCMNPNYTEFKFPQIKAHPWHKVRIFLLILAVD
ncbi:hypothetical protein L1987_58085 [Smallanthus sonchifolius]|uniref:Uncharacterized protein n=1 Tax=Smallanthus sonchifolius TaxID=185202 RepID=A0ACB9DFF4_9ASTR|nr:hypothetical protein L1987_58085 [Smallanthus sonchifolius]